MKFPVLDWKDVQQVKGLKFDPWTPYELSSDLHTLTVAYILLPTLHTINVINFFKMPNLQLQ